MNTRKLAEIYINALSLSVSSQSPTGLEEKKILLSDLAALSATTISNATAWHFLENPAIPSSAKKELLMQTAKHAGFSSQLNSFLDVLAAKKRFELLKEFPEVIATTLDQLNGVCRSTVFTGTVLNKEDQADIVKTLENQLKKTVLAEFVVDNAITAGFKAVVGNQVYDCTLDNSLAALRNRIKTY
ncbi:MAG: FoF1 ATP synthase subunit delta [Candidatus Margulisiibacteriota bacterium]